jgi:IS5 family transposase
VLQSAAERKEKNSWRARAARSHQIQQFSLERFEANSIALTKRCASVAVHGRERNITPVSKRQPSVMESVAHLRIDFTRVQVMRAAKGKAVVEQHAAVCNV